MLLSSLFSLSLCGIVWSLRFEQQYLGYNLNENETAVEAKDYWGKWENHTFHPSPSNWRMPTFVITIDRFIDGNPTNNDANETVFENSWMANQFRFGGDTAGIYDSLDYLTGMGIKTIYFTGSMMLNMPWSPDGYGPIDFTLLDKHHGNIEEWRDLIAEIHRRGMYVIFDNTVSTMADLLAYGDGFTNKTAEFRFGEYDFLWKGDVRYHDFVPANDYNASCQYPRIWEQNGYLLPQNVTDAFHGCRASEFDMYGDIKGTGAYPSYINQLSRFASVQDRLREWMPAILEKINRMSCLQITMLDIDGFRIDKAVQVTIDALADFSDYQRQCARQVGKDNFLVVGELVADPNLAAVYFGRGKQPDQQHSSELASISSNGDTDSSGYIRPLQKVALDGAAFHYDIYGSLTRFLGLDGPWGALGVDWVAIWNRFLMTMDMVNPNTGEFDPRHMFGTTNQDVFRWPSLADGTARQLLGLFVTTLELPGAPMMFYGEEQDYYLLENLAPDYVYGRTPYGSSRAWQLHGCYDLGEELYVDMPFNSSKYGCNDDRVSLDHRDPSHPLRNIFKRMFELRDHYPTLNDGYNLTTLSTWTRDIYLRGSNGMPSPTGLWSVYRGRSETIQDFDGQGFGNQGVWLLFHNDNHTATYTADCSSFKSINGSILSPFDSNTTVRNLFYPYEEYDVSASRFVLGIEGSDDYNGCLPEVELKAWEFKALVPSDKWQSPKPVITRVLPYHDERLMSTVAYGETEIVAIEIRFSQDMDCDSIADGLLVGSTAQGGRVAELDKESIRCGALDDDLPSQVGYVPTEWTFQANLRNVADGIHTYTVVNASNADNSATTNSNDRFMFRIGQSDNPMVFPLTSNYTAGLLKKNSEGQLTVQPRAAGADRFRYSTNYGSSWSRWLQYEDESVAITPQAWSGTKEQAWEGTHITLQYWGKAAGSSHHVQHSDLDTGLESRWPHAFVQGIWNQWGYDDGLPSEMALTANSTWTFDLFCEYPTDYIINVWGMNPDGNPDKSAAFGDIDRNFVLDWLNPTTIARNVINVSTTPAGGIGYRISVNDGNYNFNVSPVGSVAAQGVVAILLCLIPLATGIIGSWSFVKGFYAVKFNRFGTANAPAQKLMDKIKAFGAFKKSDSQELGQISGLKQLKYAADQHNQLSTNGYQKSVLIATIEYECEDWKIKVKIGGLGAMASLMAKTVQARNLFWVVPCNGGIEYPTSASTLSEPMRVIILGVEYLVQVHQYCTRNVTYVFLDAPVFRARKASEPYPPRMDDLDSAIYYSTWNQCIAAAIKRFQPEIYHVNDYHGAVAPLYLLPDVVPSCLSLHNAEFQGLWSLKNESDLQHMCGVFNLPKDIVNKYIRFGDVFNLLHAGVSYLREHQGGFGAVGVSDKYSKRTLARYPIFWSISRIGSLPNPDPSDLAEYVKSASAEKPQIDEEAETQRPLYRQQAQEWAGLNVDPNADLFIFIGRWSKQKGVDVIADVFPSILQKYPSTQLICIGPVIDLYGKFAALKLDKLMKIFPGRVYSKPEFTAIPPYIHKGAEFALMPSRDEPFGLVAVEFGRKGALCIGARVGGFGNMPGWWFPVESLTTEHMIKQFQHAIHVALASNFETRRSMRACCVTQRFPVQKWLQDLEVLYLKSVKKSQKHANTKNLTAIRPLLSIRPTPAGSGMSTPAMSPYMKSPAGTPGMMTPTSVRSLSRAPSTIPAHSRDTSHTGGWYRSGVNSPVDDSPSSQTFVGQRYVDSPQDSYFPQVPSSGRDDVQWQTSLQTPPPLFSPNMLSPSPQNNRLSVGTIRSKHSAQVMDKTDPVFDDQKMKYYQAYSTLLDDLATKDTSTQYGPHIEEYLMKSEQDWFSGYHYASLGMSMRTSSTTSLLHSSKTEKNPRVSLIVSKVRASDDNTEFNAILGDDYEVPNGLRKFLLLKAGTWHYYTILLALGQILCANPYQLTLLTGQIGAPAMKLYVLCSIYLVTSVAWWILHRFVKSVYLLSAPFFFFGLAFLALAITSATSDTVLTGRLYDVAAGAYTVGSSAYALYFALNFGTEAGMTAEVWASRACIMAGIQQIVVAFLWYWGSFLTQTSKGSNVVEIMGSSALLIGLGVPMTLLMWSVGLVIYFGLPNCYRHQPGIVPSFYRSILGRPLVLWFLAAVVLQCFWLSTNYTRTWMFLWSSGAAPRYSVALLVFFFFGPVWLGSMLFLTRLTKSHAWIIPIFAVCLGAPRWCQMLWSLSGIGHHIPWAGSAAMSALLSRAVWLWLGVLDGIQGVGIGTMLLMSLTRVHTLFTLILAQGVGALTTILARAVAPHNVGPQPVFPNLAAPNLDLNGWFWFALICQLILCVGFLKLYRKSQLQKP